MTVQEVNADALGRGVVQIDELLRKALARGVITDPAITLGDVEKLGVTLDAVIDRTQYGLEWNAPLPKGGFALGNDVTLTVELELAKVEA